MIVLEKYNLFLKIIGLDPHGGFVNIISRCIYSAASVPQGAMLFILFVLNVREDVYLAAVTLPAFFGISSLVSIYWSLLIHRERFFSLLDELRNVVSKSA